MKDYETEMSQDQLNRAKELLCKLGIEDVTTVNEMFNEIVRITGQYDAVITIEEKEVN